MTTSEKIYRWLLRLYPRSYLNEYEESMIQLFRDIERDIRHSKEKNKSFALWEIILNDLIVSVVRERFDNINNSFITIMKMSILRFIVTFVFAYFVMAVCFWMFLNVDKFSRVKNRMHSYANEYSQDVKGKIFTDVFAAAEKCKSLLGAEQIECEQVVSKSLAIAVTEEEFRNSKNEWDWPHDLFFVKQRDEHFDSLGWSGKLKDISSDVNTSALESTSPYVLQFLTRNCKYFLVYDDSAHSCEIYEKVTLNNIENGYIVRLVPLTEETDIRLVFYLPFLIFNVLITLPSYISQSEGWGIMMIALSFLIIPLVVAIVVGQISNKKKKN